MNGARMADLIAVKRLKSSPELRDDVAGAVRVDADPVAEYLLTDFRAQLSKYSGFLADINQVPNAAPPFPMLWLDWNAALHPWEYHPDNPNRKRVWTWMGTLIRSERAGDGIGWMCEADAYIACHSGINHFGTLRYYVDAQGKVDSGSLVAVEVNDTYMEDWFAHLPGEYRDRMDKEFNRERYAVVDREYEREMVWIMILPALLAISFMHCKNVKINERVPSTFLRRTWRDKYRRPLSTYHVLDIEGMKRVVRQEAREAGEGTFKALHIVRGHFATYTEDKPLFGRVVGTFWRPDHTRGALTYGESKHDYRVHPATR